MVIEIDDSDDDDDDIIEFWDKGGSNYKKSPVNPMHIANPDEGVIY